MSNENKEELKEEKKIEEQNLNSENFENETAKNITIENNLNKEKILAVNDQEKQKQSDLKLNEESNQVPQSSKNVSNEIGKTQNIYYEPKKKLKAENTNVNNPYQQNNNLPINQGNTNNQMKPILYNQPSQYNTMNNQNKESKKDSEGCGLCGCCAIAGGGLACCYCLWKNVLPFCCPCLDDDRRNDR